MLLWHVLEQLVDGGQKLSVEAVHVLMGDIWNFIEQFTIYIIVQGFGGGIIQMPLYDGAVDVICYSSCYELANASRVLSGWCYAKAAASHKRVGGVPGGRHMFKTIYKVR